MFELWGVESEGGARKVRKKLKVNQSLGLGFLSVLKEGISQAVEPEPLLITCYSSVDNNQRN